MLETFVSKVPAFKANFEGSPRETFRWRSSAVVGPGVALFPAQYTGAWSLTPQADSEQLCVIVPLSGGRLESQVGMEHVTTVPNTALLAPVPLFRSNKNCSYPELSVITLMFESATVTKVLSSLFEGVVLRELGLAPSFDLSTEAGLTFKMLVQTITYGMLGKQVLERSPKAMALLVEAALRLIFEHVPHRFSNRQDGFVSVAPRHVRRAANYMHANMHLPLTMTEVAEAVGVSARALQSGFQQFWDTTPTAYLRSIRLKAVHAELMQPTNKLSVGEIALKWGFFHHGRFAAQYRAAYGVSPSETSSQAQR